MHSGTIFAELTLNINGLVMAFAASLIFDQNCVFSYTCATYKCSTKLKTQIDSIVCSSICFSFAFFLVHLIEWINEWMNECAFATHKSAHHYWQVKRSEEKIDNGKVNLIDTQNQMWNYWVHLPNRLRSATMSSDFKLILWIKAMEINFLQSDKLNWLKRVHLNVNTCTALLSEKKDVRKLLEANLSCSGSIFSLHPLNLCWSNDQ